MTVDELIDELTACRFAEGGDKQVMIEIEMEGLHCDISRFFETSGVSISKPGAPITTAIMIEAR